MFDVHLHNVNSMRTGISLFYSRKETRVSVAFKKRKYQLSELIHISSKFFLRF